MANFMEDLFNSIFTAGPTPTLLIATNATFAALQILLLALFLATYSIHFAILSFFCAALWGSINWFAIEVRKSVEEAEKAKKERAEASKQARDSGDDSSGTETEEVETQRVPASTLLSTGREEQDGASRRRRSVGEGESTESEWEKISEEGDA
jgi:hypothetical protein